MTNPKKRIAVIIINYNGEKLLNKFLPSIIEFSDKKISDIYVIDNNSDDDSVTLLKSKFPSVNTIINNKNYGYAKGYNEGTKKIKHDYFVFVNSDVEVTKNWLNPIFDTLESNNKILDEIYSSYDLSLNKKYKVKVFQKTLDRIKNNFK